MSRRTAESQKAIRQAWENEQKLVSEGAGTRDWTQDQQKAILERGKAFEGQHMKSVEKYPEYQGDPGNIQFLTKKEHLEAHGGSWQNPTNWYFDPVTKEITDFGDGKYIPCEVIKLSFPVNDLEITEFTDECNDTTEEVVIDTPSNEGTDATKSSRNTSSYSETPRKSSTSHVHESIKKENFIWTGLKRAGKFVWDNKKAIGGFVGTVLLTAAGKAISDSLSGGGSSDYSPKSDDYDSYRDSISESAYEYDDSDNDGIERSSPREHDVSGYERQQNGKTVHVRPYKRGGRNNDDK